MPVMYAADWTIVCYTFCLTCMSEILILVEV